MVALGNGLALARTITTSVDELFTGTERVKSGNFEQRIAVRSDDQLGQLTTSFNDMTGRIQDLLVEQDEKRRLEQELQIARDIQMSLLPQGALKAPGMSRCGVLRACEGSWRRLLRFSAAVRWPRRPADCRCGGEGHLRGALHGRAEGVDALAHAHPHVPSRAVDRSQRDHQTPSRQPQLHYDDLRGRRPRGRHADVRARRPYAVHAHHSRRRRGAPLSTCWRRTEWSLA